MTPKHYKIISIVFADSDPDMLGALSDFFDVYMWTRTASSGADALKLLKEAPADIIVSGQMLSDMTGPEFLAASRKACPESEQIIIVEAPYDGNLLQTISQARTSYFLTKPLDFQQLRLVVQRLSEMVRFRQSQAEQLAEMQYKNGKLIEEEVNRRTATLRNSNQDLLGLQQSREQMTYMAVHDLKTPIANTQLAIKGLMQYCNDSPDASDMVEIALQSIETMGSLVENILAIAKLTKTEFNLKKTPILAADIVRASIAAFKQAAFKKSIRLYGDITSEPIETMADSFQLRQAIDNLVGNAIKYTQPGGMVSVKLGLEKDSYVISVRDDGQGMSDEDMANAFQEFKRLSAQPTGGESSTGLGLFIVKKIATLHEGTVKVQSEGKGAGSCFTITLPIQPVTELAMANA